MRIDAGHLSRLLSRLERRGLVARERSAADGRRQLARLTDAGAEDFALLDRRSNEETAARISGLGDADRRRLVAALADVRRLLQPAGQERAVVLRAPRGGDLGWIVQRHGELYSQEYGWDTSLRGVRGADRRRLRRRARPGARGGVDRRGRRRPGRLRAVRARRTTTSPSCGCCSWSRARAGSGSGQRLVGECIAFARAAGYGELRLWTNDNLVHARRIYERAGFELVDEAAAPLVRS